MGMTCNKVEQSSHRNDGRRYRSVRFFSVPIQFRNYEGTIDRPDQSERIDISTVPASDVEAQLNRSARRKVSKFLFALARLWIVPPRLYMIENCFALPQLCCLPTTIG